ncbi:UNKNOWN [Stylonychia lemnae]|uniref:Uncharacterized protein n=1 Tax=Stylonychia lemnae TaxID=5949 RepID=A0A078B0N3_STYLE|nr:UNKNOWN [Stylonychia lemnae]|eukprot:CDW86673.1 UNKNOWN [Stylonychia lemnae]
MTTLNTDGSCTRVKNLVNYKQARDERKLSKSSTNVSNQVGTAQKGKFNKQLKLYTEEDIKVLVNQNTIPVQQILMNVNQTCTNQMYQSRRDTIIQSSKSKDQLQCIIEKLPRSQNFSPVKSADKQNSNNQDIKKGQNKLVSNDQTKLQEYSKFQFESHNKLKMKLQVEKEESSLVRSQIKDPENTNQQTAFQVIRIECAGNNNIVFKKHDQNKNKNRPIVLLDNDDPNCLDFLDNEELNNNTEDYYATEKIEYTIDDQEEEESPLNYDIVKEEMPKLTKKSLTFFQRRFQPSNSKSPKRTQNILRNNQPIQIYDRNCKESSNESPLQSINSRKRQQLGNQIIRRQKSIIQMMNQKNADVNRESLGKQFRTKVNSPIQELSKCESVTEFADAIRDVSKQSPKKSKNKSPSKEKMVKLEKQYSNTILNTENYNSSKNKIRPKKNQSNDRTSTNLRKSQNYLQGNKISQNRQSNLSSKNNKFELKTVNNAFQCNLHNQIQPKRQSILERLLTQYETNQDNNIDTVVSPLNTQNDLIEINQSKHKISGATSRGQQKRSNIDLLQQTQSRQPQTLQKKLNSQRMIEDPQVIIDKSQTKIKSPQKQLLQQKFIASLATTRQSSQRNSITSNQVGLKNK